MTKSKLLKASIVGGLGGYLLLTTPNEAFADICDYWFCTDGACSAQAVAEACESQQPPGCDNTGGACGTHPNCGPSLPTWVMCVGNVQ